MTLQEIITLYDDSWNRATDETKKPHFEIPEYLSYIFDFVSKDVANECITPILENINKKLEDLERILKGHRHKTFGEGYSEKPAW